MSLSISREAIGDWSGLKGTHYHILYAIWLLLRGNVRQIAFYQGNDLLARPVAPPSADDIEESISLCARSGEHDSWIQIKSTDTQWSPQRFLPANTEKDNLLKNLICNAFESEKNGRTWGVHLITQGTIKRNDLEEFITNPSRKRKLNKSLSEIVKRAQQDLLQAGNKRNTISQRKLRALALDILSKLATCIPHQSKQLAAEVELELAYACYNRDLTNQVAAALVGALLKDAAEGPSAARTYNIDWLEFIAGFPLRPTALFDQDPAAACTASIKRAQPPRWNDQHFIGRRRLEEAFEQFLKTDETLFVLLGGSGSGKSWATVDWCLRRLNRQMRLLVPGSALLQNVSLPSLVARSLRSFASTGDWSDELLFRRFQHAAYVDGQHRFIIAIDDLLIPHDNVDALRQRLTSLVSECSAANGKLLVTCQRNPWMLYQLGKTISPGEVFTFDTAEDAFANAYAGMGGDTKQSRPSYSFLLADLNDDEVDEMVRKRVSPNRATLVSELLKTESFLALRNAYLLNAFLESQADRLGEANLSAAPVAIDSLLDERVEKLLSEVAAAMGHNAADLSAAFDALVAQLWNVRATGLSYADAASVLANFLPNQTGNLINALRRSGLVTSEGPIALGEPRMADRLFAKRYQGRTDVIEAIVEELVPEVDGGVVVALMRGDIIDAVSLGEILVKDKRWTKAVCDGLAQCSANDYRVLALAASIMRSDPEHILITEGGDALGQLAVRNERAWRWLISMYLSRQGAERHQGEYGLGVALQLNPLKTAAAVTMRLRRAAKIKGIASPDQEKRASLLRGALDPLRLIKNRSSAEIGRRLITKYGYLAKGSSAGPDLDDLDVLEDIDRVRGRIAIYGRPSDLDDILRELTSEDRLVRFRAACALRDPAIEQPSRVQETLFELFSRTDEYAATINRTLLAAYPFVSAAPDALLHALSESPLTDWTQPRLSTGQVLALLADLSEKYPNEVSDVLPQELTTYPPEGRAFLSEMLSYAWWRCAERAPKAMAVLERLCEPDLDGVPKEYTSFAIRGAAIAQLGRISLAGQSAHELAGQQFFYPYWDLRFAYLNTRGFVRKHAAEIVRNDLFEQLRHTLVQASTAEDPTNIHVMNRPLREAVFRSSVLCLEMLTSLAAASDPVATLRLLPRDWRTLNLAGNLLESGVTSKEMVDFTKEVCEEVIHGTTTFQAFAEREKCLSYLAVQTRNPQDALEEYRTTIGDRFLQTSGGAGGLARLMDAHPHQTLGLLDASVRESNDLATLYHLKQEIRSWRGLLVAGVYQRMFYRTIISIEEAKELCEQVLAAVLTIKDSEHQQHYKYVYESILASLNGTLEPALSSSRPTLTNSLIEQSHALALSILHTAQHAQSKTTDVSWLEDALGDRRGWIKSRHTFDGARRLEWSWSFLNYVYPAVRLALIAAGHAMQLPDPAGRLLEERRVVSNLIATYSNAFRDPSEESQPWMTERLQRAAQAFEDQLTRTPRDELLLSWLGDAFLRLGRLNEAEERLSRCLTFTSCGPSTRAAALYNLACVKARQGSSEDCRTFLEESALLRPLNREHSIADPDLESVRHEDWFIDLVNRGD